MYQTGVDAFCHGADISQRGYALRSLRPHLIESAMLTLPRTAWYLQQRFGLHPQLLPGSMSASAALRQRVVANIVRNSAVPRTHRFDSE
jgi:hypothetical protein